MERETLLEGGAILVRETALSYSDHRIMIEGVVIVKPQ
jgi:hypothetical protein